ncbi:MAG: flagellar biosynthetic protein FliO [Oscillospiraceae bacterium]|nr:flagellar biosynthetic protein FliO [Oscillospiraceae bacterium]
MYCFWHGFLRGVGKVTGAQGAGKHIKLLERVSVSKDQSLLLVSVDEKIMLLGAAQGSLTKLCDIDSTDTILEQLNQPQQSFSDVLQKMLRKKPVAPKDDTLGGEADE